MKDFSHPFFDEVYFFKSINSSFKKAESMIKNFQVSGNFLIISEKENSAVGRDKNIWIAPTGGLWFTMGLNGFKFDSTLTVFIGSIIHKTILNYLSDTKKKNLSLKWPNDIYYNDKKIAGILTHNYPFYDYYIVGVGINTNTSPKELENTTTSLKKIINKKIENKKLLTDFSNLFMEELPIFLENGLDYKYFNKHSYLKDKVVTIQTIFDEYQGVSLGINKKGAILLKLPTGLIQPFYSGTIIKNQS